MLFEATKKVITEHTLLIGEENQYTAVQYLIGQGNSPLSLSLSLFVMSGETRDEHWLVSLFLSAAYETR